jgi:Sec-independent protein translocase protein TatA
MFGFSFAELILVLLVILFFIKPQDLPEIARFIGKTIFHAKKLYNEAKDSLKQLEKEFEIDNLKQEFNQAITEEEIKHNKNDETIIIDMHGNEHRVNNLNELRGDLSKDELMAEIEQNNAKNISKDL